MHKFELGDVVIRIEEIEKDYEQCDLCDGTGKIEVKNKNVKIECPQCHGKGQLEQYLNKPRYEVVETDLTIVGIMKYPYDSMVYYNLICHTKLEEFEENLLFSSIEEAQLECNRLNQLK